MGAQLETQPPPAEPVTWIGRDHGPNVLHPVGNEPPSTGTKAPRLAGRKWLVAFIMPAVAVATLLWVRHVRTQSPTAASGTANSIPVVTVTTPGSRAVTSRITFTGALAARYDMPIGSDTDTRRVREIDVEAGAP